MNWLTGSKKNVVTPTKAEWVKVVVSFAAA
jgi:hypothetical protein